MDFKNIRSITTTPLKLRILKELKEAKTVSELVKSLEVSRDTIKPHLRRFLNAGLIERCSRGYRLTLLGQIAFEKAVELERTISLAKESGEFFSSHDISQIPKELVKDINLLYGGFITRNRNPYELHEKWLEILRTSSWVKGVSPIYHPDFPPLFVELAEEREVSLILTREIFEKCFAEHLGLLSKFICLGELYVCNDASAAFIVTEKGFAMGLYRDGVYDALNVFMCLSRDAVRWGLRFFDYFKSKARKIDRLNHPWVYRNTHIKAEKK